MEALIVEAYEKAESKNFFAITIKLERLLKNVIPGMTRVP